MVTRLRFGSIMAERLAKRVLLVGWDGAEWEIIRPLARRGVLPHLTRLIEAGVSGDLRSPAPLVSPVLWNSIATGKRGFRHGVLGMYEPSGEGLRNWSSGSRAANALWTILSHAGMRTHVVNWYASHPAERVNGVYVSEGFSALGATTSTVEPHAAGAELAGLFVKPEDVDDDALSELIPGAGDLEISDEAMFEQAQGALAQTASVHAVATHLLAGRDFDFCGVLYRGIERFSHLFERFSPPRMAGVSDAEVERFGGVVGEVYQFHDRMLGRLLELAGEETTVVLCSDHGFATGGRRAAVAPRTADDAATLSHRPHGVLVMAGPGVRADDTIEGASVMDVAPTILMLLGQPVGRDMDGRPLVGAMSRATAEVESVPSWDAVVPLPASAAQCSEGAWEAIAHLRGLGVMDPHAERDSASREAYDEAVFNLARSYLDARRPERAAPLLEYLVRRRPDDVGYNARWFDALFMQGRHGEARSLVDAAVARGGGGALVELAYAAIDIAQRRAAAALEHLGRAARAGCELPEFHVLRGEAYLRLGRYAEAMEAFDEALARDDRLERAWDGKAAAHLGRREDEPAAEAALRAVAVRADHAAGHFHLGVALMRLGRAADAAVALRRATDLQPDLLAAHRRLAELYEGPLGDPAAARECRLRATGIALRRRGERDRGAIERQLRE